MLAVVLEAPSGFPPLRQCSSPAIASLLRSDPICPKWGWSLCALFDVLQVSGVTSDMVTLLTQSDFPAHFVPADVAIKRHDPEDRRNLAYLASTAADRRVYLSRELTDADIVIPIGRLEDDPTLGTAGPWSVIFPGLSETATIQAYQKPSSRPTDTVPDGIARSKLAPRLSVPDRDRSRNVRNPRDRCR